MQLPGGQVYLSDADPGEGGGGAPLALVSPLQRQWYECLAAALLDHQPANLSPDPPLKKHSLLGLFLGF